MTWLLVALILFAFGRGAWALGAKSLWWDEALSLYRAQQDIPSILSNRIVLTDNVHQVSTVDSHPPLYFLALSLAVRLFGTTEFALRFLSLACIVAIVPLLYATARWLVGRRTGLAAAALGALSPLYLWYGQELRMYAMLAVLSLLSFYCLIRAFFDPAVPPGSGRRRRWIAAYVLVSACVLATHYNGVWLIAFELLGLAYAILRRRARRALFLTFAALVAAVLASLGYVWFQMFQTTSLSIGARFVPLWILARDLLNSFSLGPSVDIGDWRVLLADLVFLLFLVLGLVRLLRPGVSAPRHKAGWLLAGFLLVPFALLYLLSHVRPAYTTSRHMILISPAFYLLLAVGLTLGQAHGRAAVRRGILPWLAAGWLLVIAGTGYSTYAYFTDPRYGKDNHREWGSYLQQHVRRGDVVVLSSPHSAELYRYYAESAVPWIGLPLLDSPWEETEATLRSLFERHDRVWLAVSDLTEQAEHSRAVEGWLNEHAYRTAYQVFPSQGSGLRIACFVAAWPSIERLPDDAAVVEARYSPALRLLGYRLVSPPASGRLLHVELYWAVDQTGPEQVSVALRLVDAGGQVWGQSSQCPFNGLYPMWQWQAGLSLYDERDLPIWPGTPPGAYRLELLLVSQPEGCPGDGTRPLPPLTSASRQGDGLLLGEVSVGRGDTPPTLGQLSIERRRRARFDGLELLGHSSPPAELRPGESFDVALYWQARQGSLPDTRFRLRLVDSEGDVWQQSVVRPAGDGYPADRWQAGDRLQGRFRLWLPENAPVGRYALELVPEPPTRRRGLAATVRAWLGLGAPGLRLANLLVVARPAPAEVPLPPPPIGLDISHPTLATLGDRVRFLGHDLSSDSVRAGEPLTVTLYWQALRPMEVDYTVFVHLLDPSDQIVGQQDSMPRDNAYPTSAWQPGEVITDTRSFLVDPAAPPGRMALEAGMYRLDTLKRLPVRDANSEPLADDRILLSPVTVLPAPTATPAPPRMPFEIYLPLVSRRR